MFELRKIIERGLAAFVATMVCAFVLCIIGSVVLAADDACPLDGCSIESRLTQIFAMTVVFGFAIFFLASLMIIPFLVVFVILVRLGAANAVTFALSGAAFALLIIAFGPPLGDTPMGPQADIFRGNVTSVVGIGGLVIGALSGIAAWLVERRMREQTRVG